MPSRMCRDLYETYLPAFRTTIIEGGSWSIMGAYNRYLGEPCCSSPLLLEEILRGDWGFKGYVVSDCGAIRDIYDGHDVVSEPSQAASQAVESGCDLNCGSVYDRALLDAVREGLISEDKIDTAVRRLFTARLKLGMFDPDSMVPYAATPVSVNDCPEHRELALDAARKSVVLLKNDGGLLPLDRSSYRRVLVLGPQAISLDCLLGNYNGTPSQYTNVLEGVRSKLPESAELTYRTGCAIAEQFNNFEFIPHDCLLPPSGEGTGLQVEYFSNGDLSGEPVKTGTDNIIAFREHRLPWPWISELRETDYSARWTGRVATPLDGRYALRVRSDQEFSLFLDSKLVLSSDESGDITGQVVELDFAAGSTYELRLEIREAKDDAVMMLDWRLPVQDDIEPLLKKSDLVILCLGLSPNLEGEEMPVEVPGFKGGDRLSIGLPAPQEELIAKAAASGKPVVLVLLNGSALAVNQADSKLPAIVEAWYPGEEGGRAVADVLFGDYNPSGRLPVTFYRSVDQLPPFDNYDMQGRTYRYFGGQPLYPFGHGLSYTSFAYSDLEIAGAQEAAPGDSLSVSVTVSNTGNRSGEEVVQVYISHLEPSVPVPVRALAGFRRIALAAGEQRTVSFTLPARPMSVISDNGERVVEPGRLRICVGGKQPGFTGSADATTTETVTDEFVLKGKAKRLPL